MRRPRHRHGGVMSILNGPFTFRQAATKGVHPKELGELCAAGELVRPSQGLFLPRHLADDPDARIAAISLVLPPGAAVARETAAWLLGVDVRPPARWQDAPLLECLVPLGAIRPRRPDVRAYISDLPAQDVMTLGPVPCTTATRTALDLARYRPRFLGLGAVDALTHLGLTSVPELEAAATGLDGHRFIRRAREVIDLCEPATESTGESWTRLRIIDAGFPRPTVQISLRDSTGREVYRLDMGFKDAKVAVEYDGTEHHLRTVAQRAHDDARRDDIHARFGWRTLAADKGGVLGARPDLEGALMEALGLSFEYRRQAWHSFDV